MKPTSIIYLILSIILIATGYVSMEMAGTLAESEGVSLYSDVTDEDGNRVSTMYYNTAEYDRVEISLSDATVYLCVGDEEKVVFKNYTEGSYTGMESGVSYIISDTKSAIDMITTGNFNLTFSGLRHYWHDRDILSRPKEVYVYTTENTQLNAIDIKIAQGKLTVENYKATFDVMATVTTGSVSLISSEANSFNVMGDNTIVEATGLSAPRFHTDVKSGKISMSECNIEMLTKLNIKETGDVSLNLPLAASEYNVTAYASKSVSFNGKNVGTQYPPASEQDGTADVGSKTIDINVVSGTVSIKTK